MEIILIKELTLLQRPNDLWGREQGQAAEWWSQAAVKPLLALGQLTFPSVLQSQAWSMSSNEWKIKTKALKYSVNVYYSFCRQ